MGIFRKSMVLHSLLLVMFSCVNNDPDLFEDKAQQNDDVRTPYRLNPDEVWFPHSVGNWWINEAYIPCNNLTKEWYWEVVELVETDTANFFLLEKHLNPCDTTTYFVYEDWYAYTPEDVLYLSNNQFEYVRIEADFKLELNESYIAQGLRYTVSEKLANWMVFEYDLYQDGTYTRRWIKGLGRELHWSEASISGITYKVGDDF